MYFEAAETMRRMQQTIEEQAAKIKELKADNVKLKNEKYELRKELLDLKDKATAGKSPGHRERDPREHQEREAMR